MAVAYREAPDAVRVVEELAKPQLAVSARAIADSIPEQIPVHHGVAKRLTHISVENGQKTEGGHPTSLVRVKSPFWHFLEYGTRFNPPYRPIERGVEVLGIRYVPR
jgi:hypothetical protein